MFIVEWTDHEGNLQQQAFDSQEAAQLEAAALGKEFDHIAILWETEV